MREFLVILSFLFATIFISCGEDKKTEKDSCENVNCNSWESCFDGVCVLKDGNCNSNSNCLESGTICDLVTHVCIVANIDNFKNRDSWEAFDVNSNNSTFSNAKGYYGATGDGRYIYFAPCRDSNNDGFHGRVLRYDSTKSFTDLSSYSLYDAGNTDNLTTTGYAGAIFANGYIYFVPYLNEEGRHAKVLRYNTSSDFSNSNSWSAFDANSLDLPTGAQLNGYDGGVFDGERYIYFSPYGDQNGSNMFALRYDTTGDFKEKNSWSFTSTTQMTQNTGAKGFYGITFDGTYIYYVPFANKEGSKFHSKMVRYNTTLSFTDKEAWSLFDASNIGENTVGYKGAVFDGKYVYYVPFREAEGLGGQHSKVLRYNTESPFENANSWSVFNASNINGLNTVGYVGAQFDGRYIYFIPYQQDNFFHANILRYDSTKDFLDSDSWNAFNVGDISGLNTKGYKYGFIMDKYLYLVPYNNNSGFSGVVLRYNFQ
ncbi:hypothetical protein JXR93_07865 [bacterium]|nr:hypothetical protein [bacterium]